MTDKVPLPEADPRKVAYLRIEPIALALLERGWTQTRPGDNGSPFGPSPMGYEAHFDKPLDMAWIAEHFELPPAIRYDPDRDELMDTETYSAIYGSRPTT